MPTNQMAESDRDKESDNLFPTMLHKNRTAVEMITFNRDGFDGLFTYIHF